MSVPVVNDFYFYGKEELGDWFFRSGIFFGSSQDLWNFHKQLDEHLTWKGIILSTNKPLFLPCWNGRLLIWKPKLFC